MNSALSGRSRQLGETVFETVEVLDGRTVALFEHLQLLAGSAAALHLPGIDSGRIHHAIEEVLRRWGERPGRLRISWSAGGRLHLAITTIAIPSGSAVVVVGAHPVDSGSPLSGLKCSGMSSGVAALASQPRADEVVLVNHAGNIVEGCSSNFFLVRDGVLVTPPLSSGCRAGVTRSQSIQAAGELGIPVEETDVSVLALKDFEEAFLTSTGRHVQPIRLLDWRQLTQEGPTTVAIRQWVEDERRRPRSPA